MNNLSLDSHLVFIKDQIEWCEGAVIDRDENDNPICVRNYCNLDTAKYWLDMLIELEKDLGCPLEVREKAFDNGFYDVDGNHYFCEHYVPYLKSMHTRGISIGREKHFNLKDYTKTWWLSKTKEE